ncbi:hypothetical protein CYMTET_40040 [Cymbomonas tetramitiformis]|uniref:Uncharacterized protein n=1 Tax=Cymbomonas tetramitiformis TaxID=36881 RepID=A0AAE0C9X5_9CHLO|nr:hypothetical protein CYMTET_40040 [Cymbomonas tetramitiformis]
MAFQQNAAKMAPTESDVRTSFEKIAAKIAETEQSINSLQTSDARTFENIVTGQAKLVTFEKSLMLQKRAIELLPKTSTVTNIVQRLEKLETKFESHSQLEKELGRLQGRNEILERELKMAEQANTLLSSQLQSQQDQV